MLSRLVSRFAGNRIADDEAGQSLVEYTLVLLLVVLVTVTGLQLIGTTVSTLISQAAAGFNGG
ncbi:MAG TPA: hypothetical protein VFM13_13520 [Gaiellaceae bacterium]|nr:hypothetical protein [Gaiellaceae bacterium]